MVSKKIAEETDKVKNGTSTTTDKVQNWQSNSVRMDLLEKKTAKRQETDKDKYQTVKTQMKQKWIIWKWINVKRIKLKDIKVKTDTVKRKDKVKNK